MARAVCRWSRVTLAVGTALGTLLVSPLQAEDEVMEEPLARLTALQAVEAGDGNGVACCNLGGVITYLLSDGISSRPYGIILVPSEPSAVKPGGLEALGKRFLRAYELKGYRTAVAQDGSAVFLFRGTRPERGSHRRRQGMDALAYSDCLVDSIRWLNAICSAPPHRMEGSTMVWRDDIAVGNNHREVELSLNLLRPLPCHVDVKLNNVSLPAVPKVLSQYMELQLESVSGSKGSSLRKKLGVKPIGYMGERYMDGELALVRVLGENGNGLYRLGSVEALAAIRARRGQVEDLPLPTLTRVSWADEKDSQPQAGEKTVAAPAPPAEPQGGDEGVQPGDKTNVQAVVPAPSAPEVEKRAPAPALDPAAARQAYSERLKAL